MKPLFFYCLTRQYLSVPLLLSAETPILTFFQLIWSQLTFLCLSLFGRLSTQSISYMMATFYKV